MYVVCTYDVNEKRCAKVMKVMRKYLFHVQESVFEGELNPNQLVRLENELSAIITESDSIHFYYTYNNKNMYKKTLGKGSGASNVLI